MSQFTPNSIPCEYTNSPNVVSASILLTLNCNLACKYCVPAGTPIIMADFSTSNIEDLKVGDEVLGFDEHNLDKGKHTKQYPAIITETFTRKDQVLVIALDNGKTLHITKEHPVSTPGNRWRPAGKLKVGQKVKVYNLPDHKASSAKIISIEDGEEVQVYNIETTTHTYFANTVAVHNCFETHSKETMSVEVGIATARYLFNEAYRSKQKQQVHFMFFGGEPLLNTETLEAMLEEAEILKKKLNIDYSSSIITNCTIMNEDVKRIIKKYAKIAQISIQLSIDGVPEVQNMYRVTKGGGPSWDMVEKAYWQWLELLKDGNPGQVHVHGCLNKKTLPYLFENYRYFTEEMKMGHLWYLAIQEEDWDDNDVEIYRQQNQKIFDYIIEHDPSGFLTYAPMNRAWKQARPSIPCGAGRSYASITPKGDIYPCHQIFFNDPEGESKIGSIFEGVNDNKRRMFLEYDSSDLGCPDSCEHGACYRCIASNYVNNGSILAQIRGNYCKMQLVDHEFHLKIRSKYPNMSLIQKQGSNAGQSNQGCDVNYSDKVVKQERKGDWIHVILEKDNGDRYTDQYFHPITGDECKIPETNQQPKVKESGCSCGDSKVTNEQVMEAMNTIAKGMKMLNGQMIQIRQLIEGKQI